MKRLKKSLSILLSSLLFLQVSQPIIQAQARELPHNPVYHREGVVWVKYPDGIYWIVTDKKDWTDWSYLYYGTYPQSEEKDAKIINQINNELNNAEHGDVVINNTKYRKISINDTTSPRNWGGNKNDYKYFKWEPIKWKVIQVDEKNNKLLIMSDKSLNNQALIDTASDSFYMWETCNLRNWLNGYNDKTISENTYCNRGFIYEAFTNTEIESILNSKLYFHYQKEENVYQQTNIYDKIFLLNSLDLEEEEYGFRSHIWQTDYTNGIECVTRAVKPTDYSLAMGDWNYGLPNDDKDYIEYWVFPDTVPLSINRYGIEYIYDHNDCDYSFGMVPAMYIDLDADWKLAKEASELQVEQNPKSQTQTMDSNPLNISSDDKTPSSIEAKNDNQQKQEESLTEKSFIAKITKLKKDSVTVKFTNKTSSSVSIKTNDSKFKKKKTIKLKPGKSKSVKLKLKSKNLKKKKLKLKFKCNYAGKTYKITVNSKKVTVK